MCKAYKKFALNARKTHKNRIKKQKMDHQIPTIIKIYI